MLLNSSRSDIVYGKLCEIKSAIGLRFYEANHAFLAEFSKSLLTPPPPPSAPLYRRHLEEAKSLWRLKL